MPKKKVGRPKSDRTLVTTKIDEDIHRKAKVIAGNRKRSLADYLSELLQGQVERDYAEEVIKAGTVPKAKRK